MAEKSKDASLGGTKKTDESPLLAPKRATEEAATKDHESFKKSLGPKVLIIGLIILGAFALLYILYTYIVPVQNTNGTVTNTVATISFTPLFLLGVIIFLIGLMLPMIKGGSWIGGLLSVAGLVLILLAFFNSGWFTTYVKEPFLDRCIGLGDCSVQSGSFPTVSNGSVVLKRGESKTFYAVGRVRLNNHENYCLNISPPEVFDISWTGDGRVYFIAPYSGHKELVTVTSKPANECRPV